MRHTGPKNFSIGKDDTHLILQLGENGVEGGKSVMQITKLRARNVSDVRQDEYAQIEVGIDRLVGKGGWRHAGTSLGLNRHCALRLALELAPELREIVLDAAVGNRDKAATAAGSVLEALR